MLKYGYLCIPFIKLRLIYQSKHDGAMFYETFALLEWKSFSICTRIQYIKNKKQEDINHFLLRELVTFFSF